MFWQDHNGDVIVEFPDSSPKQLVSYPQNILHQRLGERDTFSLSHLSHRQILTHPQHMWYAPQDAAVALQYLLASADALGFSKPYRLTSYQKSFRLFAIHVQDIWENIQIMLLQDSPFYVVLLHK